MNNNTILLAVVALLVGGISGYILKDQLGTPESTQMMHQDGTQGMHRMSDGSMMHNNDSMSDMSGMEHMMGMTVSSEREFIMGMIPHHQEAIDTAKEVLARGGTTEAMRTLAQNIITAQEQEIANMKAWYKAWYGESYQTTGEYMSMMRDLGSLAGEQLDRTFLEDMIKHHMGAIMMARSVEPYIEHQEIADLSSDIISTQAEEIQLMRQLLQTL